MKRNAFGLISFGFNATSHRLTSINTPTKAYKLRRRSSAPCITGVYLSVTGSQHSQGGSRGYMDSPIRSIDGKGSLHQWFADLMGDVDNLDRTRTQANNVKQELLHLARYIEGTFLLFLILTLNLTLTLMPDL